MTNDTRPLRVGDRIKDNDPERQALLKAAINCEHMIEVDKVRLFRDPEKPGNALSQLGDRLVEALSTIRGQAHSLYTNADADRPGSICDRNGQVSLALCKRCGKGESQLEGPCSATPPQTQAGEAVARPMVIRSGSVRAKLRNDGRGVEIPLEDGRATIWFEGVDDEPPPSEEDLALVELGATPTAAQSEPVKPYGYVTTHSVREQQFFYRYPELPYLDNVRECIPVYAAPTAAQAGEAEALALALARDAARFAWLGASLYWDGHGYWLPDLCVKALGSTEAFCGPPSMDEFRAFIDAAMQEPTA